MKMVHRATHIQIVWKMSISLNKVSVSPPLNNCKALVIPERQNLCGEKSVWKHKDKTKYLPDPCFDGCLLDTSWSILWLERPRSQRTLIESDEMRVEFFSWLYSDAYTDAKKAPRRTAPNVFGMSTDIITLSSSDGNIVFREYRTKETTAAWGKLWLTCKYDTPLVVLVHRLPHGTELLNFPARLMEIWNARIGIFRTFHNSIWKSSFYLPFYLTFSKGP